jgi:hypothetical protein
MKGSKILLIDSVLNLMLGVFLIAVPLKLVQFLGIPSVQETFYPSILGGVIFGIGIALLIEYSRGPSEITGLGIGGASAINFCFGVLLAFWLLIGDLSIPFRGRMVLWIVAIILFVISGVELLMIKRKKMSFQTRRNL